MRCQDLASSWIWHCVILWIGSKVRRIRLSLSPRSADTQRWSRKSRFVSGKSWLGALAKLWKSTVNFVTSVRPHGTSRLPLDGFSWNKIFSILWKSILKIHVWFKSNKKNEYFTWRPVTFRFIFRRTILVMRYISNEMLYIKSKQTFYAQ